MILKVSIVGVFFFVAGCAQIKPAVIEAPQTVHVVDKNYERGEKKTVYIGQAMVKLKDYYLVKSKSPLLQASNDFTVEGPLGLTLMGSGDKKYPVRGSVSINGISYNTFVLQFRPCFTALVDSDGRFSKQMLSGFQCTEKNLYDWVVSPSSTRFSFVSKETIDTSPGFTNFELLYGGTNGKSFNVSYREYTPDNLARPSFFQDLTFKIDAEYIRYKDIRLKIFSVNDEGVSYAVVED